VAALARAWLAATHVRCADGESPPRHAADRAVADAARALLGAAQFSALASESEAREPLLRLLPVFARCRVFARGRCGEAGAGDSAAAQRRVRSAGQRRRRGRGGVGGCGSVCRAVSRWLGGRARRVLAGAGRRQRGARGSGGARRAARGQQSVQCRGVCGGEQTLSAARLPRANQRGPRRAALAAATLCSAARDRRAAPFAFKREPAAADAMRRARRRSHAYASRPPC
jgi:hypothetical protein